MFDRIREYSVATCALFLAGLLTGPVHAEKSRDLSDRTIADAVADEFFYDVAVSGSDIDISTEEGVVILDGTTDNILAKERAARIAQTVKGVRSVVNDITVRPPALKTIEALKTDILLALASNAAAEKYEIAVQVSPQGLVTLDGTVDSWSERMLAEKVVKNVAGVTSVTNDIDVEFDVAPRPDREIEDEVRERLFWDIMVDSRKIAVDVANGIVRLSGTVGSAAEVTRAKWESRVAGTKGVDVTKLTVQDWASEPWQRIAEQKALSDRDIAEAVRNAILYDARTALFNVQVDVENGTVTLRGTVDNLAAKQSAESDAQNTNGVHRVVNRIKVQSAEDLTDAEIGDRVKDMLRLNPYVERREITPVVHNGAVSLYGTVDTFYEKSHARYAVYRTAGVRTVRNYLDVRDRTQPPMFDPYVDQDALPSYGRYRYTPAPARKRDAAILDDIEDQLWWSPFVDEEQVTVFVDNASATLRGTVDSVSERQAAEHNAWQGGAIWVDNELKIAAGARP